MENGEQKYPTREQAEAFVHCDAFTDCRQCPSDPICISYTKAEQTGVAFAALHDELDRRQTEIDHLRRSCDTAVGMVVEDNDEISKARDLVRRMAAWIKQYMPFMDWIGQEDAYQKACACGEMIAEAEAMTKEEKPDESR